MPVERVPDSALVSAFTTYKPKEDLKARIARDGRAKYFFWTVAMGKATSSSTLRSTRVAATRRFGNDLSNADPASKPVLFNFHPIPRLKLSPILQVYFFKMERTTYLTCHPQQIQDEAHRATSSLFCQDQPLSVNHLAMVIYTAGITQIEYSRSVALLAHDTLTELTMKSWSTKKALESKLRDLVTSAFLIGWMNNKLDFLGGETGLEPVEGPMEDTRTKILNITAFAGDLFAVNLLQTSEMREMILLLLKKLSSPLRCRGLYLLLLRAIEHMNAIPLGILFLAHCRAAIINMGIHAKDTAMFCRWLIELSNVIDKVIAHDTQVATFCNPPLICHRWDSNLSCESLLGSLTPGLTA